MKAISSKHSDSNVYSLIVDLMRRSAFAHSHYLEVLMFVTTHPSGPLKTLMLSLLFALSVSACGGGSSSKGGSTNISEENSEGNSPPVAIAKELPSNRYAAANSCFALQSDSTGNMVAADGGNGYAANAAESRVAEAFFFKPSALGEYLFYAADSRLLSASGGAVVGTRDVTEDAVWIVDMNRPNGGFSIVSSTTGDALVVGSGGQLSLGNPVGGNDAFRFALTEQPCTPFPEMPLGIVGETFKGLGVDKPVIGFADVHSHFGMSHEMSADGSVGPAVGGVLYGQPFNPLGVSHALHDCEEFHGPDGIKDGNNILEETPGATHDTVGWPTFIDWPAIRMKTHQASYYRWIERAYMAGMRLVVTYGTSIQGLCEVGKVYSGRPEENCEDHYQGLAQNDYMQELQDYIDAQHGGPGEGWFRLVTSPQQAREVINDGKLAVILGLEGSQMFDCGVTILPGGNEQRNCTPESFDALLEDAWARGVRQVVPIHNIDSALSGGTILDGGASSLNLINFIDTGAFYKTVDCPDGGNGESYFKDGGGFPGLAPGFGNDPLSQLVIDNLQGLLPVYPSDRRQCNSRPLTSMGEYAMTRFAEEGLVVSIDHAPLLVKRTLLDLMKTLNPPYPIISGHGYQAGVRNQDVADLLQAGGYSYPYKKDGASWFEGLRKTKEQYDIAAAKDDSQMLPFAYGLGYDGNGFGGYNPPRPNAEQLVNYPFQLFSGQGWGPQFANSGIQPVTVEQLSIPGGRSWDTEQDGTAHYGLIADFIEEIRLEGGEEAITAFYNSAEVYLQLWEKIYSRREN
jgi:hypothetical protein